MDRITKHDLYRRLDLLNLALSRVDDLVTEVTTKRTFHLRLPLDISPRRHGNVCSTLS